MVVRRTVPVPVWLLVMTAVCVAALCVALAWPRDPPPGTVDPARIRAACQQYAGLDLSGWAAVCRDAGYQQMAWTTGAPGAPYWPRVVRTQDGTTGVVQPEDLGR